MKTQSHLNYLMWRDWENKILEQMYIQTNLQITWEGSTYGNIERNNVKIQNKNGEDPTCRNVDGKNCGQNTKFRDKKYHKRGHTDSSADGGLTLFMV